MEAVKIWGCAGEYGCVHRNPAVEEAAERYAKLALTPEALSLHALDKVIAEAFKAGVEYLKGGENP